MTTELESMKGISEVNAVRTVRIDYQGELILLKAMELSKVARRSPRKAVEGDIGEMFRRGAAGDGFIASENFAAMRRMHAGDIINLPSPAGTLKLPLVGIIRDYSDQEGALVVDRALFRKYWNDDSADLFGIYVSAGTSPSHVKEEILARYAGNRRLFVLSNLEVRQYITRLTNQWFGVTWIQISVAVFVAILGIINSLTVTIADRRRELGVLQAVGGLPNQIRSAIWMEAGAIALISIILGLALGAIHLYYVLEMCYRDFPGMRFDYMYPYGVAAMLIPILVAAALLSAIGPAESAVRGSLVDALEYE
jgi:putative ABC transport system permease protein